jgi:hypothetical protein
MLATQAAHETIAELAKELAKHPGPGRTLAILRELDTETMFIDRAVLTDTGLPRMIKDIGKAAQEGHASSSEIKRLCKSLRSKWRKIVQVADERGTEEGGRAGCSGGDGGSGPGSEAGGEGGGEGTIILDLTLEEELRAHKELLRGASGGSGASATTGSTGSKDHLGQALSSRASSSVAVVDLTLDSPTAARTHSAVAVVGGSSESGTSLDQVLRGAGVEEEEEEGEEEEVDDDDGEEVPCTVCGCQWDTPDDQMLICSGCDTLAHQWCYGVSGSIEDLPDLWYVLLRVRVVVGRYW